MSNVCSWGLTARLVAKHFGVLGERVSTAIASFDPETATEADRDQLAATLRASAQVLATARASFNQEQAEVEKLRILIANDEKATEKLAERLAAGTISETTVTMFCDELEANKARLPQEMQADANVRANMEELQHIIDTLSEQLAHFHAQASEAALPLAAATAQIKVQELRAARQVQLARLSGIRGNSTAFDALTRRAQSVTDIAVGCQAAADSRHQRPDQAARVAAIGQSVSAFQTAGETALQRLRRLSAK